MTADTSETTLLNAIMDAAVDAIVLADEDGVILRTNASACGLFGYEEDTLVGRNVSVLMPAAEGAKHDGYMAAYLSTGDKKIIGLGREVEGQRRSGETFPLHLSVGEARVGETRIFVAILQDLSRRVAGEAALARSQRLDALGQMTGGIAHDFNNLLTVIIGNLELAQMAAGEGRMRRLIDSALEAAETGAGLTSQLTLFARRGNLKPVRADLREICETTLDLLQRTLGREVRIERSFPPGLSPILIDPAQMQSALINLAINARDAMPEGGHLLFEASEITIDDGYMAQETDVEPGHYVRLTVSDDGTGMSPEAQRRAFEPFFTTKSDSKGSGLGLAMVYGFVRQSGGHITVYSELGHGTSFGLYFPALQEKSAVAGGEDGAADGDLPRGHAECILVVEDNPKVRKITVDRVEALGYRTCEAGSGDAAYEMIRDGAKVDLVFSDLVMPGAMNGYDLAARITEEFPAIRILLTSGYASDVVTGQMSSATPREILHKPYHQRELAERLQALLAGASG